MPRAAEGAEVVSRWSQASIISPQAVAAKIAETLPPPAVRLTLAGPPPAPLEQTTAERLGLEPSQPAELPAGFGTLKPASEAATLPPGVPTPPVLASGSPTIEGIRSWLSQRDAMMLAVDDERQRLRARLAELDLLACELEAIGAKYP